MGLFDFISSIFSNNKNADSQEKPVTKKEENTTTIITASAPFDCKILEVCFKYGDYVNPKDVLVRVLVNGVEDTITLSLPGTVTKVLVCSGDKVKENEPIMELISGHIQLTTKDDDDYSDFTMSVDYSDKEPAEQIEIPSDSFVPNPNKLIFIDTETTGLSPAKEEILQLAIINLDGEVLYNSYFKPKGKSRWSRAEKVNGISPEMVADAPSIDDEKEKIQSIIDYAEIVVGYNLNFDIRFLEAAGLKFGNMYQNDLLYSAANCVRAKNHRLVTVASALGFDYSAMKAHDALTDTLATKHVYDNVGTYEKLHMIGVLKKSAAMERYGKIKFQYKKVQYNAVNDWDAFVAGCELKIQEKGKV